MKPALTLLFLALAVAAAVAGALWLRSPAPPAPPPVLAEDPITRAYQAGRDTAKDAERYIALGPQEDPAHLAQVLEEILADSPPLSQEDMALRILSHVAQRTRMKYTDTPSGTVVLQQGYGFCNGMALAFVALCKQAGMPARVNALHNIEWMEAHNTAEVYYGGMWHCFDPTYNTIFYTEPSYPGGRVVSLAEIVASPGAYHCLQLHPELWTGEVQPAHAPLPLSPDAKYGNWGFTLSAFYDHAFRRACPVVHAEDDTVSYPIEMDLREREVLSIGEVDGDVMDTYGKANGRYPRFHGLPYLGQVRLGNAMHLLTIRPPRPCIVTITYHLAQGSEISGIAPMALRDAVIADTRAAGNEWTLVVRVQSTEAQALVVHRTGSAYIDAVTVQRATP